ncbi:MAG: hypothetical protein DME19_09320 [Verrucomicrobia bacterium]|nr:MAG: hypothetical protein DME19_09320 [Verrucomicrobiota bacterium]
MNCGDWNEQLRLGRFFLFRRRVCNARLDWQLRLCVSTFHAYPFLPDRFHPVALFFALIDKLLLSRARKQDGILHYPTQTASGPHLTATT